MATFAVERIYEGFTLLPFGIHCYYTTGNRKRFITIAVFYQSKIFYLGIGGVIVFGAALGVSRFNFFKFSPNL
ncbi:MAG: hypothetical protein Ct9H300mP27_07260 [Chloroflexota bacterium]|nr:MAG: hypothetical protein Ct9H300mP27_07260 [Chloroflexota bacterium]